VKATNLAKSPQDMGNVGTEDTSILMTLVDNDMSKIAEVASPMAIVVLEHRMMKHIWIG